MPMRSARPPIWSTLSSPDTYSTGRPSSSAAPLPPPAAAAACSAPLLLLLLLLLPAASRLYAPGAACVSMSAICSHAGRARRSGQRVGRAQQGAREGARSLELSWVLHRAGAMPPPMHMHPRRGGALLQTLHRASHASRRGQCSLRLHPWPAPQNLPTPTAAHLQQQRALAHSRVSAHQRERPRHHAAPQHARQLAPVLARQL